MRQQFATVLVALMLVTAGCSFGGSGPGDSGEPSDGTSGDAVGTINFYISDQPGAIEDFEHLNVTINEVAFQKADGNETDAEDEEATATNVTDTNTTDTEGEADAEDGEGDESGWQTFDVDNRTVDLTELKGENATLLQEFEVENGTYTQVRINVNDINGTLTDGSSADVKLPSEKLRINQQFTVGNNESVDFVYDINVVKRGNSGSYNIKPVAGQSGTDVPINKVGEDAEDEDADEDADADDEEATPTPTATDDGNETDAQADQGRMNFYISDQQNAIDDFQSLNVTIDEVSLRGPAANGTNTTYEVDNRTVDLTELKGDNATLLRTFDVPAGNYTKVFISINDVNGTLTNGSSTDVKLPSERLQLNENFEVTADSEIDFVYDITVVKRGNSGSYNIQPVASESGTDVPIKKVGGDEEGEDDESDQGESGQTETQQSEAESETAAFNATFVGNVTAGENATVSVSQNGTAIENATVTYNETEYLTDADGNATFSVPSDAEEVEVEVTYENETVTLEETLESDEAETETSTESDQQSGSDSGSGDDSGSQSTETETETATATPTETASS